MAVAIDVDTLQGTLGDSVWFHLDLSNDVLYLRNQVTRNEPAFGEETSEGFTVLRTDNGAYAGMTVVNYWKRFGDGDLCGARIQTIKERVGAWMTNHTDVS